MNNPEKYFKDFCKYLKILILPMAFLASLLSLYFIYNCVKHLVIAILLLVLWFVVFHPIVSFLYGRKLLAGAKNKFLYTLLISFTMASALLTYGIFYGRSHFFIRAIDLLYGGVLFLWCEIWALVGVYGKLKGKDKRQTVRSLSLVAALNCVEILILSCDFRNKETKIIAFAVTLAVCIAIDILMMCYDSKNAFKRVYIRSGFLILAQITSVCVWLAVKILHKFYMEPIVINIIFLAVLVLDLIVSIVLRKRQCKNVTVETKEIAEK